MSDQSTTPPARLQVCDLRKEYPTPAEPLVVLRGLSLEMSAGESLAVVGPSGSGKTTLLNIIGTLDQPTSGSVMLNGVNPFLLKPPELAAFRGQKIGFVFQDHHLLPQCTALENVLLPRLAIARADGEAQQRAAELLQQVGLRNRATHLPSELSGGERQRVAIARAMMNQPSLLLCDEPTGNLDATTASGVGELLAGLCQSNGTMLIIATHSRSLAAMFDRRGWMEDGRLAIK